MRTNSCCSRLRPSIRSIVLVGWLAIVTADGIKADDAAELITDRPDQTESSLVVQDGSYQLEVGWTFTRDHQNGVLTKAHEAPGSLLRVGLLPNVELRIGWTGFVTSETRAGSLEVNDDGIGDGEVGIKVHLAEEQGKRPEMALLLSTSLPIGDSSLTSDRFDPSLRLAFSHSLSDRVGMGYNVGLNLESEAGVDGAVSTLSSAFYTLALGFELSDRWGAFIELYGGVAVSASGDPTHSFDGGFTYLLRDNVQLDIAAGLGLSDAADDVFFGLGLSVRFPD